MTSESEPSARSPRRRHDPRHEPLLRAAISGELDLGDPALESLLARCADCRDQLESLLEVRTLLDAAGLDSVRETRFAAPTMRMDRLVPGDRLEPGDRLDSGRAEPGTGGELHDLDWHRPVAGRELVGPFVHEQLALAALARERVRRRWWQTPWVAAASAAILVAGWAVRGSTERPAETLSRGEGTLPRSATLGAHERRQPAMSPSGPVAGFDEFVAELQGVPGGQFHLTVWDDRPESDGRLLAELFLDEPKHTFSPDVTRPWPDRIRWDIEVQDPFGSAVGPAVSAFAQR
jgi:hypothetical protein